MYKVQLTLTPEETSILSLKADKLGYNVAKYLKLLIGREILRDIEEYPVMPMSRRAEEKVRRARAEHKKGRSVKLSSFKELATA